MLLDLMDKMSSTGLKRGEAVFGGFSGTAFAKVVKSSDFFSVDVWNTIGSLSVGLDTCLKKIKLS